MRRFTIFFVMVFGLTANCFAVECADPESSDVEINGSRRIARNYYDINGKKLTVSYTNIPWRIMDDNLTIQRFVKNRWELINRDEAMILLKGLENPDETMLITPVNGYVRYVESDANTVKYVTEKGYIDCYSNFINLEEHQAEAAKDESGADSDAEKK